MLNTLQKLKTNINQRKDTNGHRFKQPAPPQPRSAP